MQQNLTMNSLHKMNTRSKALSESTNPNESIHGITRSKTGSLSHSNDISQETAHKVDQLLEEKIDYSNYFKYKTNILHWISY